MRAVAGFVAVMIAAGTAHPVFAGEESVGRRVAEIAGSVSTSAVVGPLSIGIRATVPVSGRQDFETGIDWLDLGYRERSPDQWALVY